MSKGNKKNQKPKTPSKEEIQPVQQTDVGASSPDSESEDFSPFDDEPTDSEAEIELEDAVSNGEEPKVELEVMDEDKKPRVCIGHHPITKEKRYR